MAKKNGFAPFVFSTVMLSSGGGEVTGGGSGQGGLAPYPVNFETWKASAWTEGYDFNNSGTFELQEYFYWFTDQKFTKDQWIACGNSGDDWDNWYEGEP